jgi:hypothetical protein
LRAVAVPEGGLTGFAEVPFEDWGFADSFELARFAGEIADGAFAAAGSEGEELIAANVATSSFNSNEA